MLYERCIYCGHDQVPYRENDQTTVCPACGNTIYIAEFKSKLRKLEQVEQERDRARTTLAAAQAEKRQADERLFSALTALENIQAGQAQTAEDARQALALLSEAQEAHQAMEGLMNSLLAGQSQAAGARDALSQLMGAMLQSQAGAEEKLSLLQSLSTEILSSQGDVLKKLKNQADIVALLNGLQMEEASRAQLISDFYKWSVDIHAEDAERLREIQSCSSSLIRLQSQKDEKISALSASADRIENQLNKFYDQWQADQLRKQETLYRQAMDAQCDKRFLEAEKLYQQVQAAGENSAAIYWNLILCHYGVEYLYSEAEDRQVPTFYYPDLTDPATMSNWKNLMAIVEKEENKGEYLPRIQELREILDAYRAIHLEEKPYDVFLSVKQSDENHYTLDSDKASDLYDTLTNWGLKVFNSRRCMNRHAGHKYEPYILAALMTARVMIVVGTKKEYMEAKWVKNEWLRYQWLENNEKKINPQAPERLLLCYLAGGMQPSDIPAGLNPDKQAIRDGVGAESALRAALGKPFPFSQPVPPRQPPTPPAEESAEQIISQMRNWLANRAFDKVSGKYNQVIDQGKHANEPEIHLLALCAKHKVTQPEQLAQARFNLSADPLAAHTLSIAEKRHDEKISSQLKQIIEKNRKERGGIGKKMPAILAVIVFVAVVIAAAVLLWPKGTEPPEITETPTPSPTARPQLLGDVNGDGIVDSADSTFLGNYLMGEESGIVRQNADINQDGQINSQDYHMLMDKTGIKK